MFYLCRQRVSAELGTCIPSLPPHPNSYSRNIVYLVSSPEQEAVIAADRNRQSGSNGGGVRDSIGDGDSGKEDDRASVAVATAMAIVTAAVATTKTTAATAPGGGTNNNQQNKENVVVKATAAVRW